MAFMKKSKNLHYYLTSCAYILRYCPTNFTEKSTMKREQNTVLKKYKKFLYTCLKNTQTVSYSSSFFIARFSVRVAGAVAQD